MIATIEGCQNAKGKPMLDAEVIHQGFSNFRSDCVSEPLVYLDNAATTQKPTSCSGSLHCRYYERNGCQRPPRWLHLG